MTRLLCAILVLLTGCARTRPIAIDDPAAWAPHPADGVALQLADDAGALRLDFRFTGGGYAIARREVDLDLPDDYTFTFRVRGAAPTEHLEFKLIDDTGENVWWHVWHDVVWPHDWRTFRAKKRQIAFAWGPRGGGELHHVAAIEFAITAGSGGEGTVWIDDLQIVPLEPHPGPPPEPKASATSAAPGHGASLVLDNDAATFWAANPGDAPPTLTLDFQGLREYGGLVLDWVPARYAVDYAIEAQDADEPWRELKTVHASNGGRDYLALPESQSRRLRLRMLGCAGGQTCAIAEIAIKPVDWSATREAFVGAIAHDAPRGLYPRAFLDEPIAWTVVGADFDTREGLIDTDGAIESGPGGFSIEPFLWTDDHLVTWNDVTATPSLAESYLPIPSVAWDCDGWRLTITALGIGESEKSSILARYRLENTGGATATASLLLALRPFQVNPPSQFLNIKGGTAPVTSIAREGTTIVVNEQPKVVCLTAPDAFGATTFAGGDVVADYLNGGTLPTASQVVDPESAASAALRFDRTVAPGAPVEVALTIPLHEASPRATIDPEAATQNAIAAWTAKLNRVTLEVPDDMRDALLTLKAQLGFILVNRAGPAIQPGARAYARSWIRDGALTSEALLRLGHADAVRDFLLWFAPHQYESGKIPCVVDQRGADPVPEHDSTGEFIFLVAEYYRQTGDREALAAMWPRVLNGITYLESLLAERRTTEFSGTEYFGILPPSISHEGYSAKPMHSYWDDFWTLRGYKDAVDLAAAMGDTAQQTRLCGLRDRFAADLGASIAAAMKAHAITYIPGCADLGDFDATSTTIALDPVDARTILPPGALDATFEKYWDFFTARRDGAPWDAFTPYEIRTIGAFEELGWDARARELLTFFLAHRTPAGWRQWPEVVWHNPKTAHFIGDMPHTWVGSDYIRSMLVLMGDTAR